ncbi:FecR family protein [Thalassospira australica]|uniref:FecR family protein n=1 Tax=Thalassospira australica TaxID=1528106 RepID=UPI00051A1750|nr:FecR domain-containing protein [Thalassospira australica]
MYETQETIDLIAAQWVARLIDGDLCAEEHDALNAWLDQNPAHQQAFLEANDALALMDASVLSRNSNMPHASKHGAQAPNILSFEKHISQKKPLPRLRKRTWGYVALAASLLIALISTRVMVGDPTLLLAADYHTSIGEVRAITLEDGSTVTLGPESAIAVTFTAKRRHIELLSGLADFQAVSQEQANNRPFEVSTANGVARALGTRFVIDSFTDYATVAVLEHQVEVNLSHNTSQKTTAIVSANEAVQYNSHAIGEISSINPDRILSWQKGKLIFDRITLRDVVEEFSRYRRGTIIIANEAAARKRVSGVFDMSNPQTGLELIATELDVHNVSITPLLTVLY